MSEVIEMDPQLQKALVIAPEQAEALVIQSNQDLTLAAEGLKGIKRLRNMVAECFDPIISKAHEAHKEALAQKKKAEAPLTQAEGIIKPKIAAYSAEQERIRKAEEDRLRKIQEEEEQRREEERRRADEELRKATELEEAGKKEEAEAALKAAEAIEANIPDETPPPPVVASTIPKIDGVSIRKIWKYEIVDASKLPREFMVPNETLIGQAVRSSKGQCSITGVRVYSEDSVAAGR